MSNRLTHLILLLAVLGIAYLSLNKEDHPKQGTISISKKIKTSDFKAAKKEISESKGPGSSKSNAQEASDSKRGPAAISERLEKYLKSKYPKRIFQISKDSKGFPFRLIGSLEVIIEDSHQLEKSANELAESIGYQGVVSKSKDEENEASNTLRKEVEIVCKNLVAYKSGFTFLAKKDSGEVFMTNTPVFPFDCNSIDPTFKLSKDNAIQSINNKYREKIQSISLNTNYPEVLWVIEEPYEPAYIFQVSIEPNDYRQIVIGGQSGEIRSDQSTKTY